MAGNKRYPSRASLGVADLPAIEAENLCFAYPDGTKALGNVSCQMAPGKHHAIIGHSGSGKSTFLALIADRFKPLYGHLEVRGKVATIYQDLWLVSERETEHRKDE